MDRHRIVERALAQPNDAVRRTLTTGIRTADPELHVVEADDLYGNCYRFAAAGHCTLLAAPGFENDMHAQVHRGKPTSQPVTAWWTVEWSGATLEFVEVELSEGFRLTSHTVLMSRSKESIFGFLAALDRFASEIEGAVLVFQDGCWRYNEELYEDIRNSTFENLVLPPGLAETIRGDVRQWIESRALYEEHGIPWKRGLILVGPPGNGKTHLIKALVNEFELSALYVRGFSAEYKTDAQNISAVFERARACAPAMLILEDVDTLVNPENRSHFLNELDGFAKNTGIFAVASANDPAKLDPALVHRPSRFDRRDRCDLPAAAERQRYLQFFTSSLNPLLRLSDAEAEEIGAAAEGFSYAYLKELVLSSMMAWISDGGRLEGSGEPFADVLRRQIVPLQAQMAFDPEPTPTAGPAEARPRVPRRR